ncbi:MAG: DUF805 domain-containing protein [Candidatus Gastranaerophilales bacterium]|nr:DUF805 domain-containing protein [Candidatus Gastranaerophilales bacterium]
MIASFCKSMCDFSFRGRSTKREFLCFLAVTSLISLMLLTVILFIAVTVLGLKYSSDGGLILPHQNLNMFGMVSFIVMCLLSSFYGIFSVWAFISGSLLAVRRLHDMNYSGVCYWIWITSILMFFVSEMSILTMFLGYFVIAGIFVLAFSNSFASANKYGKVDIEELSMQIKKQNG